MTTELELAQTIETRPDALQKRLVDAMRTVGERIVQKPEIVRALAATDLIPPGVVITNEAQAAEIADAMLTVIDGQKALRGAVDVAARIPKQMEAGLKAGVEMARDTLDAARVRGGEARVQWQREVRRQAAVAEAAAKAAAVVQASKAEDPDTPVAEVAPVPVARVVSGGTAKSGTQIRVEPREIVTVADVPAEWLLLATAVARAVFLSDERTGKVKRAAPGESIVYRGVRFESVESDVNRSACTGGPSATSRCGVPGGT